MEFSQDKDGFLRVIDGGTVYFDRVASVSVTGWSTKLTPYTHKATATLTINESTGKIS